MRAGMKISDIGEGVGMEVYRRTKRYKVPDPPPNCPCLGIAMQMNQNGPDWCDANQKDIARQIGYNAANELAKWILRRIMGPVFRRVVAPALAIPARFLLLRPAIRAVRAKSKAHCAQPSVTVVTSSDRVIVAVAGKE